MIEELIEFYKLIGKLKKTERTGWITRARIENPESVADHTFRTAVIAMIIGDMKKLDTEKLVRMALIHDFEEAITGDYDRFAKKLIPKEKIEQKKIEAIKEILSLLPSGNRKKYFELWQEYEEQKSEYAKLMYQIEKTELLIQAFEYQKEGIDPKKMDPFWRVHFHEITDSELKKIVETLNEERKKS